MCPNSHCIFNVLFAVVEGMQWSDAIMLDYTWNLYILQDKDHPFFLAFQCNLINFIVQISLSFGIQFLQGFSSFLYFFPFNYTTFSLWFYQFTHAVFTSCTMKINQVYCAINTGSMMLQTQLKAIKIYIYWNAFYKVLEYTI